MSFDDDELRSNALESALDPDDSDELSSERADLEQAIAAAETGRDPGIALLLELARQGKIDPWNIDIIKVTDEYLRAFDRLDARELARSARCIFYAAALVHLKARALAEKHSLSRLDAAFEDGGGDLDDFLRRGLRPGDVDLVYPDEGAIFAPRERRPRSRGVTLVDLILALKSFDERLAAREALELEIPAFDGDIAQDECLGITHQDDVERDKGPLRDLLARRFAQGTGVRVDDRELVGEGRSRVSVFLALLSMANDNEVVLEQEQLYGGLLVSLGADFGRPRAPSSTESATPFAAETDPANAEPVTTEPQEETS